MIAVKQQPLAYIMSRTWKQEAVFIAHGLQHLRVDGMKKILEAASSTVFPGLVSIYTTAWGFEM